MLGGSSRPRATRTHKSSNVGQVNGRPWMVPAGDKKCAVTHDDSLWQPLAFLAARNRLCLEPQHPTPRCKALGKLPCMRLTTCKALLPGCGPIPRSTMQQVKSCKPAHLHTDTGKSFQCCNDFCSPWHQVADRPTRILSAPSSKHASAAGLLSHSLLTHIQAQAVVHGRSFSTPPAPRHHLCLSERPLLPSLLPRLLLLLM